MLATLATLAGTSIYIPGGIGLLLIIIIVVLLLR